MAKHSSLNVPASIVISGVESDTYFDIVVRKCGIRFILMSYHYLQKKPKDFLKKRMEEFPDLKIFIDSGAHTFLSNRDDYMDKPMSYWESYIEGYIDFLTKNKEYVFACADLDIDFIVGQEQVDKWRDEVFESFKKDTGVEVCYIWHSNRGQVGWKEMCKKYDYIGLSYENDAQMTLQKLMGMINVAKGYNTRVHGMALTKTEFLVRVPFFTADSTTWLVGQQYGELNWFNGRKMQRLSKDQWRRQYKTQLLKEPFNADWDRLINGMGGQGDTYELLRLNVLAYILAEEHIRKRLHSKMYWMDGGVEVGMELVNLNSIVTPSKEWFDGDCEDWKSYLEKLRLPTDNIEKDEAVNILSLFYIFINNDYEELEEEYTEQELIDYAKLLGSDSEDYKDSVEFMKEYFIDNATGKRNDFREIEMEDENVKAKERLSYIEDDAFDIIDLSEEQINNSLSLTAPKEMPEVDEYDEELRKNNIVPVRASDGKFLKGQKKVRRPKDIYSSKYPRINCTTCYKSGDCPEYRDGYVCAFDKMFKRFDTRNSEDVMDAMSSMINHNLERLQRAMMFEIMDGGMVTPEVTGLIDQNAKLLEKFQQIKQTNAQTVLQQRRTIMMDGTETIENSMSVNPSSGGILSKIFGSPSKATKDEDVDSLKKEFEDVIEVDYNDIED